MGQRKQRKQRQKPQGVLADHETQGRVLVPPLMSLGAPMVARAWHREMLPDFLWLAAMLGRRSAWRAAYEPLDVLDEFVPDGRRILDGRLSSFALVPEDQRAAAREALQRRAPNGLPSDLRHMFALYPTCPARWLYEDWLEGHEPASSHACSATVKQVSGRDRAALLEVVQGGRLGFAIDALA